MNDNDNYTIPHSKQCERIERMLKKIHSDISQMNSEEIKNLASQFQTHRLKLEQLTDDIREAQLQLQVQLQLQATEDRYHNIYEKAPIAFILLNKNGYISHINQAACLLFDHSKNQLTGTRFTKYIHNNYLDRWRIFFEQLQNCTRKQSLEIELIKKNKKCLSVLCQGSSDNIDKNNPESEFLLALHDISEQKQAIKIINQINERLEEKIGAQSTELLRKNTQLLEIIKEIQLSKTELMEREAKLNSIFNAAVEGIVTINQTGLIECVNKAITKIFGYQADELIGQNVSMLLPINYKRKQHNDFFHNFLSGQSTIDVGSIRQLDGRRKDGTLLSIDLSFSEYQVDEKVYFTGIIRDMTERRRKELLDKKHLNELAHATRLGLMGEMASGIAHEVNQPLTAIATYSQVCIRMLNSKSPDLKKLRQTLEQTEKQALRAGQVIAHMRAFISSNEIHRASIDINDLLEEALTLVADDCKQFNIKFKFELALSLPHILVDKIQIEQVILNLVKNSIDALANQNKCTQRWISIQTYLLDKKNIEVRIKDNGPGISIKTQARIFSPFFTTKESGMGMGLSISHSLITAHGGELKFDSTLGKGTTFYITLPTVNENGAI